MLYLIMIVSITSSVFDMFHLLFSVAIHGVESSAPVPAIGPRVRPLFREDFLELNPPKTISELNSSEEDGTFVVFATVEGLVEGQDWWYPACRCHRSVTPDSGAYYCKGCAEHVFHMVPRSLLFHLFVYNYVCSFFLLYTL